jgi:hypothetical protein
MRYRLAVLAVLNILILLLVWQILKPKKPTVYGIVDLGGDMKDKYWANLIENRTKLFKIPRILQDALEDLAAAGQKLPRRHQEEWLRKVLVVEPLEKPALVRVGVAQPWWERSPQRDSLEKPALVRVGVADRTPAEQAAIVNAALRAYIRYFDEVEINKPNESLQMLEGDKERWARLVGIKEAELAKLNDPKAVNALPNLDWRKKI